MAYHPVELPDGTESLSHSRRNDYAVCPRLFFYKHELGLKPIDTPAPLRMGAIISDALEARDRDVAWQMYADLIAEAIKDGRNELVDVLLDEQQVVAAATQEKLKRPEMHLDGMEPEVVFVGGEANGFVDNGRFDEIVEGFRGGVLIIERKFKTYFSQTWAEQLLMDDQVTSYVNAAIEKYDVKLKDVHVQFEVMWKPRVRRKKDESNEAFRIRKAQTLELKHEDHHTILLPGDEILNRNAQQLQDWWDRFERMGEDIIRERELANTYGSPEAWPQHPHSCHRFNKHCEFITLCTAVNERQFSGEMKRLFTTREDRAAKRRLLDEVTDEG